VKNEKKTVKRSASKSIKKVSSQTSLSTDKLVVINKPVMDNKLYAFPSFDKSNSLIYFASTYARLLNSGEVDELARVIRSYCLRDCPVKLHETLVVSLLQYVELLSVANIFHPDSVCCMHSTKVEGNKIKSVLYFKYSDVPEMYVYADTVVTDPQYKWVYVGPRREIIRRNLELDRRKPEVQAKIYALLNQQEVVQVYGKVLLSLTFDQYTKKIVHVEYECFYTSICHKDVHIQLD
jgi:hypothetical protein